LEKHYHTIKDIPIGRIFAEDRKRGERLAIEAAGIYPDYSKNRITDETLRLLLQLARESGLREHIDAMFRGRQALPYASLPSALRALPQLHPLVRCRTSPRAPPHIRISLTPIPLGNAYRSGPPPDVANDR
jgi:hypothetical protein